MPGTAESMTRAMRRAGLRITEPRRRILKCMTELPRHFGADEVLEALGGRTRKPAVSRATIYRLLSELERLGLLRKVLLSGGHSHYEFAFKEDHHYHLVCSRCGKVVEVYSRALEKAVVAVCIGEGIMPQQADVEITIVCDLCQAASSGHVDEAEGDTDAAVNQ